MNSIARISFSSALALAVLGMVGCDDDPTDIEDTVLDFQTSFEEDLSGFQSDATDLGDPQVEWSVARSTEMGEDDDSSVRLDIDNTNTEAKVWIERDFDGLRPNTLYDVTVSFDFATADFGTTNTWSLFVDADSESPDDWLDFVNDAVMEDTGNGEDEDSGHVWLEKLVPFQVETDTDGMVHVAIGVWGSSIANRSYFIDNVEVTVSEN